MLNPLSLDVPTFLSVYIIGSSILLLVGFTLRWWQIDRTVTSSALELNEDRVAYLAGGKVRAIDTARIKLIRGDRRYQDRPLEKAVAEVDDLLWVAGESVNSTLSIHRRCVVTVLAAIVAVVMAMVAVAGMVAAVAISILSDRHVKIGK